MKNVLASIFLALLPAACRTPAAGGPPPQAAPESAAPAENLDIPLPLEASDVSGSDSAVVQPEAAPEALATLGMISPLSAQIGEESSRALGAYLARELGGAVPIRRYPNVGALGEALAAGHVDVAWLTPTAYVAATAKGKVRPLVRFVRGGYAYYRSGLFVRKDAPLYKIADLKGKKMIWAPEGSASGRMFPLAMLRKQGLDPAKFFSQQLSATDHRDVCQAVLEGRADAGATISDEVPASASPVADGCRGAGIDPAAFRVLATSDRIPSDVFAARDGLPPVVERRMRETLLGLGTSDEGRALLRGVFKADGFAEAADEDYEPVREAAKAPADPAKAGVK